MRVRGIGDPVEVKFFAVSERLNDAHEFWRPATICYLDEERLGVAYSDGRREMLQVDGYPRRWRDAYKPEGSV